MGYQPHKMEVYSIELDGTVSSFIRRAPTNPASKRCKLGFHDYVTSVESKTKKPDVWVMHCARCYTAYSVKKKSRVEVADVSDYELTLPPQID